MSHRGARPRGGMSERGCGQDEGMHRCQLNDFVALLTAFQTPLAIFFFSPKLETILATFFGVIGAFHGDM